MSQNFPLDMQQKIQDIRHRRTLLEMDIQQKIQDIRDRRTLLESMILVAVYELLQLDKDNVKCEFNIFTDCIGDEVTMCMTFRQPIGRSTAEWIHIPFTAINDYYNGNKDKAMADLQSQRELLHTYVSKE